MRGRLTEWNDDRGFGFVTSLEDDSRAFVHVSAFPHDSRRPEVLDLVTYEPCRDERGRLQAQKVAFLAPVRAAHSGSGASAAPGHIATAAIPLTILAAILITGLIFKGIWGAALLLGYVLMGLLTFASYAADKSAAVRGRFRTQESALHLLEFAGGWPGALIAQRTLRHKSSKQSYQLAFWICVVLNMGALVLILYAATPG
jgi:uncharacterized membrane protein YsdA (DUF1294 family)/cold shock CspA family protein